MNLTRFQCWMVRSNLATIAGGEQCLKLPPRARRRLMAKVKKEFIK